MNTRTAFIDLLRYLLAEHAGGLVVSVTDEDGKAIASARLPAGVLEAPPPPAPKPLTKCEQDILALLQDKGKPMKGAAVLSTLEQAKHIWGESTVRHALCRLVSIGRLTNTCDGNGYGLPEWEST